MKTYYEYLTEGLGQSEIVTSLAEIVNDWRVGKRSGDSVSYKKLFGKYTDDPIIGSFVQRLFNLTKTSPVIQFVPRNIGDYQKSITTLGGFDPKTLAIHFFVDPYDLKSSTVAHELSHLYDFVMAKSKGYDNQKSYIKAQDDPAGYRNQEYEVRARFYGEIDNHTNKRSAAKYDDSKFIDSIVTAASIPDIFKNKYRGLAYKILKQIDEFGLNVVRIIEPEKVVRAPRLTKMEQLENYIKEVGIELKVTRDNTSTITIELDDTVLSQATESGGTLKFPILDTIVDFYKGNSKVRFVTLDPSIYHVLTSKYGLTPYKNDSNYRVNDSFVHFKHRKLKTDKLTDDDDLLRMLFRKKEVPKIAFAIATNPTKNFQYFDDEEIKNKIEKFFDLGKIPASDVEKNGIYEKIVNQIIKSDFSLAKYPIPKRFIDRYRPNLISMYDDNKNEVSDRIRNLENEIKTKPKTGWDSRQSTVDNLKLQLKNTELIELYDNETDEICLIQKYNAYYDKPNNLLTYDKNRYSEV